MWIQGFIENRKRVLWAFAIWAIISLYFISTLKFSFSFEQFFPKGDEDLTFFNDFIEEFETDDNFLLLAIESETDIFNRAYLNKLDSVKAAIDDLPFITGSQSISDIKLPDLTQFPFGMKSLLDKSSDSILQVQKPKFLNDDRFVYNLINKTGTSTVINIKTEDNIDIVQSKELMTGLTEALNDQGVKDYHILGRAYFQDKLSDMQKREVIRSSIVSMILVALILFLIYRKFIGIIIALVSIGLGLIIFMGLLGLLGRELNAMSAFYPVLMLIVGTSDIIHIMTKYLDELKSGKSKEASIDITIREIGLATLLTSLTTSAGFLSLMTSKVEPIKDFGLNSALGVMVAYITVLFFSTALLSYFKTEQLITAQKQITIWDRLTGTLYNWSLRHSLIKVASVLFIVFCFVGMSKITTDYKIESNLPRGEKISEDFFYFEREYGGFRPFEFAVICQGDYLADDQEVIQEVSKLEDMLKSSEYVKTVISPASIFKTLNQVFSLSGKYEIPENPETYNKIKNFSRNLKVPGQAILFNKERTKTRVSSRINDYGAETIKGFGREIDMWITDNIDDSIIQVKRTGTGLLLDKNSAYIRDNLLYGLGMALVLVSLLMGLLFRNLKMVLVSLVPNTLPLVFAAAILGWVGIELEAGITIVFAIVFGIAVDDTIHFLSKYKLCRNKGMEREVAIERTFKETGKAIIITSIILFFGFLIMLFSIHPPSVTIGLLISLTLVSAIIADLLLLPMLLRWFDL